MELFGPLDLVVQIFEVALFASEHKPDRQKTDASDHYYIPQHLLLILPLNTSIYLLFTLTLEFYLNQSGYAIIFI
jgi:hypothetical protein